MPLIEYRFFFTFVFQNIMGMNIVLWVPRLLYKIYFLVVFISTLVLLYPLFYWMLSKEERFSLAFRQMKFWSLLLHSLNGIWVKKEGCENLPRDRPFILCANHASYLDIIMMYRVMPDYFVMMGKGEIQHWPLFKRFFTTGMNILVHRESNVESHRAFTLAKAQIDKGRNIAIFPEGAIPDLDAPKMKGFKNGAFKMAIEKQVPIVPMTFVTNWKLLEGTYPHKGNAGPGLCHFIVHEPIETTGMTENDIVDLRNRAREEIAKPLRKFYREDE